MKILKLSQGEVNFWVLQICYCLSWEILCGTCSAGCMDDYLDKKDNGGSGKI